MESNLEPTHGAAVAKHFGSVEELEVMWSYAEKFCQAKFIPREAQKDPASVFFLLQIGKDLGIPMSHALRSLYMTPQGRIGIQGDIALSLLYGRGFKVAFTDVSETGATCSITRPDGQEYSWTFSRTDAARIIVKLSSNPDKWGPLHDKATYKQHPKNMYQWRALMNCARFGAADLLGGMYLPEELEEIETEPELQASGNDLQLGILPEKPAPQLEAASGEVITMPKQPERQTEPTRPEPPKRGRPKKSEPTTAPPPAAAAPEPLPPPSDPEDPGPEEPPEVKQPLADELIRRVKAAREKIRAVSQIKSDAYIASVVNDFFRAFLNVTALPKEQEEYVEAIDALEAWVQEDKIEALVKNAALAGRTASGQSDDYAKYALANGWTEEVTNLARKVGAQYYKGHFSHLLDWLRTLKLAKADAATLEGFLGVAQFTRKAYILPYVAQRREWDMKRTLAILHSRYGAPTLTKDSVEAYEAALKRMEDDLVKPSAQSPDKPETQEELPWN